MDDSIVRRQERWHREINMTTDAVNVVRVIARWPMCPAGEHRTRGEHGFAAGRDEVGEEE